MGDFLLDLRPTGSRALGAGEFLKFYPDMRLDRFEYPEFGLLLSSADQPEIWGPWAAPDQSMLVALCGRLALNQSQWDEAAQHPGPGGLACKYIQQAYLRGGIAAVESLSGNFVILVFDRKAGTLALVTDRWGLVPAFASDAAVARVFSSHPDALADAVGEGRNWDLTSFAEFILTGKLSAPFTYYRRIKALPVAATTTFAFVDGRPTAEQSRRYFDFAPHIQDPSRAEELAEQFAAAFRQAMTKRTLPLVGRSAVALSGGLDSRTVLCAAPNRQDLVTFSCYDEENNEFQIARSIAREAGVEFVPLKRDFDYYGAHAALGVRISGGMGCIASNHFLGFRDKLREMGVANLITGCYCDYLFKGLALNRKVNPWTTRDGLDQFGFSYYSGHFRSETDLGRSVRARLEELYPAALRRYDSEAVVTDVERRRMFPLCYEEDNAERTIPQRTMPWYVPIAENDLMEVVLSMSVAMKLNRSLFVRMVEKVCGDRICRIPDANTGAPVNASPAREALAVHWRKVERLARKLWPSNATAGSWLNWTYYARHSQLVRSLWTAPNPEAEAVFRAVLGDDGYHRDIEAYEGRRIYIFMQLFTLKLWFDQRRS